MPYLQYSESTIVSMRHLLYFCLPCVLIKPIIAQHSFPARDISIHWETVQNDYQNKPQSLNAVILTNNSTSDFPGSGWKMYFNSARLIVPDAVSGNASIHLINGDLFSLTPSPILPPSKPRASVRIEFIAEEPVVNITDGPEGFYLVWDDKPDQGFPTGSFTIDPFKPSYKGLVTPAMIYDQNKLVKDIPMDKLIKIFPTPVTYQETGGSFTLTPDVNLTADERFTKEKAGLQNTLEILFGKKKTAEKTIEAISLIYREGMPDEAYVLDVKPGIISISASGSAGIFYGIQSLKTLVPPDAWSKIQKSIQLPAVSVKDEPRFSLSCFYAGRGSQFPDKKGSIQGARRDGAL